MTFWASHKRHIKKQLIAKNGLICMLCKLPISTEDEATLDHIKPRSLGGKNKISNLQLAHQLCNVKRGNATKPSND